MKYLLDSNTISDIYNLSSVNHPQVIKKILNLNTNDALFVSILTLYEFEYALSNSPKYKKIKIEATIQQIQQDFIVLPLSLTAAKKFGNLKNNLKP